MDKTYDTVIIGGGFYGLRIALYLYEHVGIRDILVIEKESEMMTHASYNNQARVHNGYHYPRSVLTALRSRVNFPTFSEEYSDAVVNDFAKYYAVAKKLSKVNATQFKLFCQKINADFQPAPHEIKRLHNDYLIDDVFLVKEYAFDARKLRNNLLRRLASTQVALHNGEEVTSLSEHNGGLKVVTTQGTYQARHVLNCGYSQINKINSALGLPVVPLKHELTEMCLIQLPVELKDFSITVMDGPFFSIMPFPDRGLSTLSHVRYTPHTEWRDADGSAHKDGHSYLRNGTFKSNFPQMYADVVRYIPGLKDIKHIDSLWEIKTVLVQSEESDSRPILFKPHYGLRNYTCIMGGKLDNIYDALEELGELYEKEA